MKTTQTFIENINTLNRAADLLMVTSENGFRIPEVCFIRAMRTMLDPNCKKVMKYKDDLALIYEVMQMVYEIIIKNPDLNSEWVIQRNICMPPLSKEEKNAIGEFINKVRKENADWIKLYQKNNK